MALTVLKAMFNDAWSDGVTAENPAKQVKPLDTRREDAEKVHRRPFTSDEVSKLFAATNEEDEWFGFMLFADDTGQRLKDIAQQATSENIEGDIWDFKSFKTGKQMRIALTPRILAWLEKHAPASGPAFPKLSAVPRSGTISNQFYKIMVRAGIMPARKSKPIGKGKSAKREANEISFHSFRHTAQSWLIEQGLSRELAMAVIGHDDEDTNKGYTHLTDATLRRTAKLLAKRKR
jgi:integrase